jgi:hypothetical protein
VDLDGAWVTEDEAYRARGYVEYEGRWVTPAEHEALVRERAAEEAAAWETREAELRLREAEARAREAEARAREAEAAQESTEEGGFPLWWGWGGAVVVPPGFPPHGGPLPEPPPPGSPPPPKPPDTDPTPPPPAAPKPIWRAERASGRPSGTWKARQD